MDGKRQVYREVNSNDDNGCAPQHAAKSNHMANRDRYGNQPFQADNFHNPLSRFIRARHLHERPGVDVTNHAPAYPVVVALQQKPDVLPSEGGGIVRGRRRREGGDNRMNAARV